MNARTFGTREAILLVLGAALGAGDAFATPSGIIFDQTPTNTNGFSITDFRLADDFTLGNLSTVQGINFYYISQFTSDLSAVTYAVYNNNAGGVGSLIRTETIASGSVTETGQSGLCPTCNLASFPITALNLSPGTYWLEVHAGSTLTDLNSGFSVDWAAVADNASFIARFSDNTSGSGGVPDTQVNFSGFNNYAFQLTGAETPEPGTATLFALGIGLLAVKARRRAAK